ncbi:MAG TPA: hypothetical protein VM658_00075 [bacterium]|nr:hypothetical protein [bacterium]
MTKTAPATRCLIMALAAGLALMACQPQKKPLSPGTPKAAGQNSFPIPVYTYETTFVVNTSPDKLQDYFARDLSWVEKTSSSLRIELPDFRPGMDLTSVGQVVDFNIRIMGIKFPCQLITLKYLPDRELWTMIYTRGSWLLFRYEFAAVPEGTRLKLRIMGQPSPSLDATLEVFPLARQVAARIDQIGTFFQSEFDPDLPARSRPGKELRGELARGFLQGYESSVPVDAPPREVMRWIGEGGRLRGLFPNLRFEGQCAQDKQRLWSRSGELIYCPASYQAGAVRLESTVMSSGGWEQGTGPAYSHHVWIITLDTLTSVRIEVRKKGAGSELKLIFAFEMPDREAPESLDLLYSISEVPDRARAILEGVKRGVEGI